MSLNVAFAVGGLLLTRGSGLLLANGLRRESWDCCPEAEATILSASVCEADREGCSHVGYVIYRYQVENEEYSALYAKSFPTESDAHEFVGEFKAHSLVARYSPECPQESCLFIDLCPLSEGEAARILSTVSARS